MMQRCQPTLFVAILIGLTSQAFAADSLPPTTAKALSVSVAKAYQSFKIGRYEAIFSLKRQPVRFQRGKFVPQGKPVRTSGRCSYAADGLRWRGEYAGYGLSSRATPRPYSWQAGFDGQTHYDHDAGQRNFKLGSARAHEGIPLQILIWSSHGASFATSLRDNVWAVESDVKVGKEVCYKLTRQLPVRNRVRRYELYVVPQKGYLPVAYKVYEQDKLSWSHELLDFAQTPQGRWYPRKILNTSNSLQRTRLTVIRRFESNPKFAASFFKPRIPPGVTVEDYRSGVTYRNDPWAALVRPIMKAKFNWPAAYFVPLRVLSSYIDPSIARQPVKDLLISQWLQGKPIKWSNRKGKVTLLLYSPVSLSSPFPKTTAALKELYRVYKRHGFDVVQVTPHTEDIDSVRRAIKELRIPWAVAMDRRGKTYGGKTNELYKMKLYYCPLLIDHEGKIHVIKREKFAVQCHDLLKAAGVTNPRLISVALNQDRAPRRMHNAIKRRWMAAVQDAPQTAKIRGTAMSKNKPVPNVEVTARLVLEYTHRPFQVTQIRFGKEQMLAVTDERGRFEFGALTKGTYILEANRMGFERARQTVSIGKPGDTVQAKFTLQVRK